MCITICQEGFKGNGIFQDTVSQNLKSRTCVKDQPISSFMLYSVMNHYKEKNLKSIDWFWRKLGF